MSNITLFEPVKYSHHHARDDNNIQHGSITTVK